MGGTGYNTNVRSAAQALEEEGLWTRRWLSEPAAYMPRNPLPEESAKRIRYAVFESHSGLID
jgi:hypothetical protein